MRPVWKQKRGDGTGQDQRNGDLPEDAFPAGCFRVRVQHKNEQDKRWYISKEYADKELVVIGFYVGENCTIPLVRWTVAGRMFIYDLMKKAGNKLAIKL